MSDLAYSEVTAEALPNIVSLMRRSFPESSKFTSAFLHWQYFENPVGPPLGYNVSIEGQLVGHVVGIPQRVQRRGESVLALLLLNVATDPSVRKRGLFVKLVAKTLELAKERGVAFVTGVANGNTQRIYNLKFGFQNVACLNAHVEMLPGRMDMGRALREADVLQDWSQETLAWRLRNPVNPLKVTSITEEALVVEGRSSLPMVGVRAIIPRRNLQIESAGGRNIGPSIVIGLNPTGTARHRLAIAVPDKLRPSPLQLIYKNLDDEADRLDPDRILFSFLDFDAF